jgi:hypothetical protein
MTETPAKASTHRPPDAEVRTSWTVTAEKRTPAKKDELQRDATWGCVDWFNYPAGNGNNGQAGAGAT